MQFLRATTKNKKKQKPLAGKKIVNQLTCVPHRTIKHKIQIVKSEHIIQTDIFKEIFTKKSRQSFSRLQQRPVFKAREKQDNKQTSKNAVNPHSESKSKSKTKVLSKSKSLKQLGKKSKSTTRLQTRHQIAHATKRQQRKSASPDHFKSTISFVQKKTYRSHYNSKTQKEHSAQAVTDRSKGRIDKIKKQRKEKSGKQNIKIKKKASKTILMSEQYSKPRRTSYDWQSGPTQDEFLYPIKEKAGVRRKSRENHQKVRNRLSLTNNAQKYQAPKNVKTEVQLQSYVSPRVQIQHQAAIKIQKNYRGYLTRRYIRQCFEHNAAVKIQKVWRGYQTRKKMRPSKSKKSAKILQEQEYLIPQPSPESQLHSSRRGNQKWASILQEILSQESINQSIKKKISSFLQNQRKQQSQSEVCSQSGRSSVSSKLINNEIISEKMFFQKQKMKKTNNFKPVLIGSPQQMTSPKRFYHSPQAYHKAIFQQVSVIQSTQLLIENLKNIQKFHKERLESRANNQKQQLNQMLIKNKLSPRTHEKKYKAVDIFLQNQLQKFNESINQIVKNCMLYQNSPQKSRQMIKVAGGLDQKTPKKQLAQLFPPNGFVEPNLKQKSQQLFEYYRSHKEQLQKQLGQRPFDCSYQFIQQYLINLIDFVRQYDQGRQVQQILSILHKPRNNDTSTILRNLGTVTQQSEEQQLQNSFRLPLYKYIDLDEEIISNSIIQEFTVSFQKLQRNDIGVPNLYQQAFSRMVIDCMNQALNSLRPTAYPFINTTLSTINTANQLSRIPPQLQGCSEQQMKYQLACAQALSRIFCWNKMQWGRAMMSQNENQLEVRQLLLKQQDLNARQLLVQQQWYFYDQLIELIGLLSSQLFESIVYEEVANIWSTVLEWSHRDTRSQRITVKVPTNKNFFGY